MKTWITSDLHFGHVNIMKFCPKTRMFNDVNHMNTEMTNQWNNLISPDDLVYILGDVSFMPAGDTRKLMLRLNGSKILIEGNHDKRALKDPHLRKCFKEIHPYLEIVYNKTYVCMFHYPISEWNGCHRGSVHFHGHCHGNPSGIEQWRSMDVGYDATGGQIAVELDIAIKQAMKNPARGHHQKEEL